MASDLKLTIRQTEVLLAYKRASATGRRLRQAMVAAELGVSHARVGQIVSRLVANGYLVRDDKGVRVP